MQALRAGCEILVYMQDSIFTKIIKGEVPCHRVYEDAKVIAFLDIHPQVPGHTLVVPKKQVDHVYDLDDETYGYLWNIVKKIAPKLKKVTASQRVGIAVEGFGVPHVHVHLIPLHEVKDFKKPQDLSAEPDHAALAEMARKLYMEG